MKTRLLSKKQMQGLLSMKEVVELCARTFEDEARGGVDCPAKVPTHLQGPEGQPAGTVSVMPAFVGWQNAAGCKFIGGNTGRRSRGLPYIYASQLMIDPATGDLTGVMDAEYLTQMRTGAQTGAALRFMKGEGASLRVGLFGCGSQGYTQIQALAAVARITELRLYDIYRPAAEKMAGEVEGLVQGPVLVCDEPSQAADADLIVLVTLSLTPVLKKEWVRPGTLIFALGTYQEVESELILAADKVIVDHIGQTMERGCLKTVVEEGRFGPEKVYATVPQLALGQKPLGDLSTQILLCVMIGTGMLDIAVGQEYLKRAEEKGVGALFDFLEEE